MGQPPTRPGPPNSAAGNSPKSSEPVGRPAGGDRRAGALIRGLLAAACLLAASLAYLYLGGVPSPLLSYALGQLAEQGTVLEVDRLRMRWRQGWEATNVRWYDSPLRVLPRVEADTVRFRLRPSDWIHRRTGIRSVVLHDAVVRIADRTLLHQTPPDQILTLDELSAQLKIQPHEILVHGLRTRVLGLWVEGEGCVLWRDPGSDRRASRPARDSWLASDWFGAILRELQAWNSGDLPRLKARFVVLPQDPARSTIRLSGEGRRTVVRGVTFDEWALDLDYEDRALSLERCEASAGGRRLQASGRIDWAADQVEAHVESTLAPIHWLSLMPSAWRDAFSERRVFPQGGATIRVQIGPAPLTGFRHAVRGQAQLEEVDVADIRIERAQAAFHTDQEAIYLRDVEAEIGDPSQRGSLRGECTVQFADRSYVGWCDADLDFRALLPVLNPTQRALLHRFQFGEQNPSVRLEFAGRPGGREALFLRGDLLASGFSYRGAYVQSARASILTSNRVTRLDPLRIERDDGTLDGSLRIDLRERTVDYEIDSGIDPKAVARASSDALQRILRMFSFEGPTHVQSAGRIVVDDRDASSAQARVAAERLGLRSFVSDRVTCTVDWQGDRVVVQDIDAALYGGRVTGRYEVFEEPGGERPRYRVRANADGVDFEEVVRTLFHREGEPYRGRIDGDLTLTGLVGPDRARVARGDGWLRIRDGRITQIPVFGGLSRWLSRIFPGLGFTTQTEFQCRYAVEGWRLILSDVKIQGNVFSLTGDGYYDVETEALDFDVEFKLLGEGLIGNVVQWVTLPISNLVKFDLEGTWSEPRWRPKNLPKELFEGFDK